MMRTRIESNPRLLNLNRQKDPTAHDYIPEDLESDDPVESYNLSRITSNPSMEKLSKNSRYEKNQVAAR